MRSADIPELSVEPGRSRHPGLVAEFSSDGSVLDCSGSWSGNVDPDQGWRALIDERDHGPFDLALRRAAKDGEVHQLCARTHAGERWTKALWTLAVNERGHVGAVAVEHARQEGLSATYRKSLESSPIGLMTLDEDGVMVFANRFMERMFGYDAGELTGMRVEALVPTRYRDRHPQLRAGYAEAPAPRAMGEGRKLTAVRKDGSEFSVEIGLRPLVLAEGRFVVASVVDTTKRNAQEEELQARIAELQDHHVQTQVLGEMNSLLQHAASKEEAVEVTYLLGKKLFGDAEVALYTLPPSRDGLSLEATWGDWTPESRMEPDACWAVRRSQQHLNHGHSLPTCRHFGDEAAEATLCIPMSAHGMIVGLLSMRLPDGEHKTLGGAVRSGQSVADQLALALSNIQLRHELKRLAIKDPLTDLFNRRYLEESITRELTRAVRHQSKISVAMLDIDDFKLFNDTKGHQAADEVLSGVGALLRTHFRGEDIACRYGGEEFILVLPDCDLPDAVRRMEELRRAFAREKLGVTFSAGLAEWPTHGRDWTGVVKQADAAMYEAKRGGKNRTAAAHLGADDGQ